MVDAPVSGGIAAANGGTLTFMVGGSDAAFARAEPILAAMGKAVIHAGASGAGQAAKICNNMILGATMIATCEAFALADKLGLDLQTFYDISSKASGQSWSMTSYCPVPGVGPQSPADKGYQGGFATNLMLKDLLLAMAAAEQVVREADAALDEAVKVLSNIVEVAAPVGGEDEAAEAGRHVCVLTIDPAKRLAQAGHMAVEVFHLRGAPPHQVLRQGRVLPGLTACLAQGLVWVTGHVNAQRGRHGQAFGTAVEVTVDLLGGGGRRGGCLAHGVFSLFAWSRGAQSATQPGPW